MNYATHVRYSSVFYYINFITDFNIRILGSEMLQSLYFSENNL